MEREETDKTRRFDLKPTEKLIKDYTKTSPTTPAEYSAYDLPSVESIVRYMHAAAGLPVKSIWLKAIKKVSFSTWQQYSHQKVRQL